MCRKYNFSNSDFLNIHFTDVFLFNSGYTSVVDKRCNFFYEKLVSKKFIKPCYQTVLRRELYWADAMKIKKKKYNTGYNTVFYAFWKSSVAFDYYFECVEDENSCLGQ